jgi:molybdate transport system substrate-binding protein
MPPEANRRIDSGEAFDVAFVLPPMMDLLITQGKIVADTRTHFLRIGIGVAVRAGAVKPDISSVDAIKRALLNAKTIAYLQGGASGPYLAALIERLGISRELQPKTLRPDMDIVGDLVARGEADIGVTAISTLLATPGVEVVGPLPQEIQSYVYFEGGIATNASAPDAARALLKFLTERSTVRVIKSKGMEPWEDSTTPSNTRQNFDPSAVRWSREFGESIFPGTGRGRCEGQTPRDGPGRFGGGG